MTFVFFIYHDIQWSAARLIGFIPGGGSHGTMAFIVPGSMTNPLNIDEGSNVGVTGLYIYRVDACLTFGPRDGELLLVLITCREITDRVVWN